MPIAVPGSLLRTPMTSIVELFPKCRKLAYDARQQLAQLQNGVLYVSELYLSLDELTMQLNVMEQLVHRETPGQREVWKRKILELQEDARSIRRQGEQYDRMIHANVRQQRERDELLTRRRKRHGNHNDEEQDLNHLADEAQSLRQSTVMVDELITTGAGALTGLVDQRQRMRGVKRLVLDMGKRLGLTNSTLRIIERRDITDAYLVFAGIIVTCIVIYFCYFHFN